MLTFEQISLAAQHLATVVDPWVFIKGYANLWKGWLLYIATRYTYKWTTTCSAQNYPHNIAI
jgi:hypothetical protein